MGVLTTLFLVVLVAILVILMGGVYSERVSEVVRRRVPDFTYAGDTFLLWGLLGLTVFVCGTVLLYMLSRP